MERLLERLDRLLGLAHQGERNALSARALGQMGSQALDELKLLERLSVLPFTKKLRPLLVGGVCLLLW